MNTELPEITGMIGEDMLSPRDRYLDDGYKAPIGMSMSDMSDNEPRMEDRSLSNQMVTIDSMINNLMQEYDMVVRNQEFDRAQMIADKIGMLDVQKSQLQAGFALPKMSQQQQSMAQQKPMQSLRQPKEIQQILDSISK